MGEGTELTETSYENLSITIDSAAYQGNLHGSIVYGISKSLQNPEHRALNHILDIEEVNRILPEGYYPQKWPGPVEDWAITDSAGKFCIGQSVSKYEKPEIPFLGVRKDFYQARQFEQRIKPQKTVYDRLTGVFVVNIDEQADDFRKRIERDIKDEGEVDVSIVLHELEPSEENAFRDAGSGLNRIASD